MSTRPEGFWTWIKILLLPSCRTVNCFINNHLIFCNITLTFIQRDNQYVLEDSFLFDEFSCMMYLVSSQNVMLF